VKTKLLISLLLGLGCLWIVLRDVNWQEVTLSLANVNWTLLIFIFLTMPVTHFFRARRWGILLKPLQRLSMKELFGINAVGFLAIHVFPFRLGEFSRPILLKKRHRLSLSTGLAIVAIERVFDGLVTTLALFIGLISLPVGHDEMPTLSIGIRSLALFALAIFLPCLGFLILSVVQRKRALLLIELFVRVLPPKLGQRVSQIAENFFVGLLSLPNILSLFKIFVESLGVWGVMVLMHWIGFKALNLDLPWGSPFSVLGIAAMGVMLPGAPGFVGTYQLFVQAALGLYGISKSTGFAYSMVIYVVNLVYVGLAGLVFLPLMATPMRVLYAEAKSKSDPDEKNI